MKKRDLATLAVMVISAGLLIGGCQQKNGQAAGSDATQMTADAQGFFNALSPENQKKFNEMDEANKKAAVDNANKDTAHDANKAVEAQYKIFKK